MPAWLTESVIYEINTATFSPEGTFNAVSARLDELRDLGVNLLWLMPIHPLGKLKSKPPYGSPYAVRDYYAINPAYGGKDDLHHLIREAHNRRMRVVIDIVANHTAWDSVLMEHPDFYKQDGHGNVIPPNADWTDVAGLNYDNPQLRAYMTAMLEYWIREFDLDGFRCDMAGLVPTDFWEHARAQLETIKPDIVMLAEWEQPDLLHKAFDLDYSWALYHAMEHVIMNGAPASDIRNAWWDQKNRYQPGALHMRFSDNHDEQRAVTQFGLKAAMAASVLMFTLDGVPLLYNGQEVGDATESGSDALFHQLKIFWPIANRRPQFPPFYKQLIALRRESKTLQTGELEWIDNPAPDHVLTFRRRGEQEFIVAVNLSSRPVHAPILNNQGVVTKPGYSQIFGDSSMPGVLWLPAWGSGVWLKAMK